MVNLRKLVILTATLAVTANVFATETLKEVMERRGLTEKMCWLRLRHIPQLEEETNISPLVQVGKVVK